MSFRGHFRVLGAWKIALDLCCFFKGSFQWLLAYLGGQRAWQERHWEPFWSTLRRQVEMWKLCSRVGGSVILKETGGPEQAQMHHCGHSFFRMRLGRHFLQKLMTLGLHWGPFGRPWGAFFCNFCNVFSGSDFRLILDMLLVGAGGRGGAAERCRFCRLAKKFAWRFITRCPDGCGEFIGCRLCRRPLNNRWIE